jgi:hypothetical protein
MKAFASCMLVVAALLFLPAEGAAQEKGQTGVFMGYPSLGLIWHPTERIAIRPEVDFSFGSGDSDRSESSSAGVAFGATVLFYAAKRESAALYFAPRYAYTRSSSEIESTSLFGGDSRVEVTSHASHLSGSIGAQYWLSKRFSIFGEAGVQYTWGTSETESFAPLSSDNDSRVFGTRSSIAAIWYF